MNKTKILLFLPVVVLFFWVLLVQTTVSSGVPVTLPVRGYDPRDILGGQYLAIQVDYSSFPSVCDIDNGNVERYQKKDAFFCADAGQIVFDKPANCAVFIKGYCQYGRFYDNVSRFYVPETDALPLERALRSENIKSELMLSVTPDGTAFPIRLIMDGLPYKEFLKRK